MVMGVGVGARGGLLSTLSIGGGGEGQGRGMEFRSTEVHATVDKTDKQQDVLYSIGNYRYFVIT